MVAGWMLYMVLVSALLLGAGRLLEEAARRVGMPQRGVWAAAMAASGLLPLASSFRPAAPPAGGAGTDSGGITLLDPVVAYAAGSAGGWTDFLRLMPPLEPLLLGAWMGGSAALLFFGLFSALRLRRAMRGWEERGGEGPRVLVSEATGPAVIGLFPGAIVLPRWAAAGDPGVRRLMLAHEEEHLRARDPALLLAASALVVALPWNLPLWWQLRRLRLAVEVDCDSRVLGRGSDLRAYATLLMEVGRRRAGLDPALLAFAEPASFLERRIRIMTRERRRRGWAAAAALSAVSVALVMGACRVEQPTEQVQPEPAPVTEEEGARVEPGTPPEAAPVAEVEVEAGVQGEGGPVASPPTPASPRFNENPVAGLPPAAPDGVPSETQPQFTPRDREPRLENRVEFSRALEAAYPSVLKDAGIGGRVLLWVRLDETGAVTNVRLYEPSGQEQLDQAAMQVMREHAEFSPASNRREPVAVWIAVPVTFQTTLSSGPAFSPRESRPPVGLPPRPQAQPQPQTQTPAQTPRQPQTQTRTQTIEVLPNELSGAAPLSERPAFSPRDVEPTLQNRAEFGATLERLYPPELRDAGITGRVLLWVFVDEGGRVANVRIYESSGNTRLDEAAVQALRTARFTPAQNKGETVPVWVALPVTFGPPRN